MQALSWNTGDGYRCEDGTVMRIESWHECEVRCIDDLGCVHVFDGGGADACAFCQLVGHGNMVSRISGSVGA